MNTSEFASGIRHMAESDAQADFASGERALDTFFAKHAYGNSRRGLGVTYVMPRDESHAATLPPILGFYTISTADITSAQASHVLKNLPRYPTPAALIGRLGVDQRAQRMGVGRAFLARGLGASRAPGPVIHLRRKS